MDMIHKIITFLTNPLTIGLVVLLIGLILRKWQKVSYGLIVFSGLWIYLWATPLMTKMIGLSLEDDYPPMLAEDYPSADAICILGGGIGIDTNKCVYPDMSSSADRVWHGARLYKAGKAKLMTVTGGGSSASTFPLLADFGVSMDDVVYIEGAKNTEDEARLICERLRGEKRLWEEVEVEREVEEPKVLLVTSAWHMRRAEYLFRRAGLDVIPAATDHMAPSDEFKWSALIPSAECLGVNCSFFKEHFAYWCYRVKFFCRDK